MFAGILGSHLVQYDKRSDLKPFIPTWSGVGTWLDSNLSLQDKADLLYNDDQQSFLSALMDLSMEPVDRALADNLSLSLEDYAEALRGSGLISAGATDVLRESGGSVWLSEHHLYGTAALGIRSYPDPGAGSSSELRSSYWENRYGLSTAREWYSCGYGEVVSAGQRVPWGAWSRNVVAELHHTVGLRQYSVSDHLGNVLATVLDRKSGHGSGPYYDYWVADMASATDYYPFGMPMQERLASPERYRLGYNGQQKSDEVYGKGNLNTALFWEYDTRLAKRWNMDPKKHFWESDYSVLGNSPILNQDVLGDEWYKRTNGTVLYKENKLSASVIKKYGYLDLGERWSGYNRQGDGVALHRDGNMSFFQREYLDEVVVHASAPIGRETPWGYGYYGKVSKEHQKALYETSYYLGKGFQYSIYGGLFAVSGGVTGAVTMTLGERLLAGATDVVTQTISSGGDFSKYNPVGTAAAMFTGNPFVGAVPGSFANLNREARSQGRGAMFKSISNIDSWKQVAVSGTLGFFGGKLADGPAGGAAFPHLKAVGGIGINAGTGVVSDKINSVTEIK